MGRAEKRLDIALEAVKQQIGLATAIIGVTLAFSDQLTDARQGQVWKLLPYAVAPLAVSVVCGVFTLMSIAYHLRGQADPLGHRDVRISGVSQNITFLFAVVAMVYVIAAS
jgi:hypothetical protein